MVPMTMSTAMTFITMTFVMAISMSMTAWAIIITLLIVTAPWAAIAYYRLMVSITSITGVYYAVIIKVCVWPGTVANHFITAIQVIAAATGR
jgi:hypothetical protein